MRTLLLTLTLVILFFPVLQALPQTNTPSNNLKPKRVQTLNERLEIGETHYYIIENLKKGDVLYIYAEQLSGNLDPLIGVTKDRTDYIEFEDQYNIELPEVMQTGKDFAEVFPPFADEFFMAWNDDGGEYHDASLEFEIPEDGDYQLVLAGAYYRLTEKGMNYFNTFGKYKIYISVNDPGVLNRKAKPGGKELITETIKFHKRVEELRDTITEDNDTITLPLNPVDKGNTLDIFIEATSGNLKPSIRLRDFGDKLVARDNIDAKNTTASLTHTFKENSENYYIDIRGDDTDKISTVGDYRILLGINSPEVLTGSAEPRGRAIVDAPILVDLGLQIDQITKVNQKQENFTVVGNIFLNWLDPEYAFDTDSCNCNEINYTPSQFDDFIAKNNLMWPQFIIHNQQGKRYVQEAMYRRLPDGQMYYYERFTVTLQAPDFDFRRFPFDPQDFYVRILSIYDEAFYEFGIIEEFTQVGTQLGEEEWYIKSSTPIIDTMKIRVVHSFYSLKIQAERHKEYYIFRLFLPLLLISIVSWVTFFMRDYAKRVDVSVSNLIVFVAFNFTLGSDLPRLGYLTFMDNIIVVAFIVNALAVVFNVVLKRLETADRVDLAMRFDKYILWGIPILYTVSIFFLYLIYYT